MNRVNSFLTLFILCSSFSLKSQNDTLNKARLTAVMVGGASVYGATMVGLHQLWYKDVPSRNFHFFNDNEQWLQMDKAGHTMTSYYLGKAGYDLLKWSGVNESKATWYGGVLGLVFLSSVEVFDGFSSDWGFSNGDMLANGLGTGLFISQQLTWKEQRILLKYSFSTTDYASSRPNVLGANLAEQLIKDYNGQTYWLSTNVSSFLKEGATFPKWLNVAVGYSADGMYGGRNNVFTSNDIHYDFSQVERKRQFYLSLDIDLTRIKTKSKLANSILSTFGFIKFPFPALEFSGGEVNFKPIYF